MDKKIMFVTMNSSKFKDYKRRLEGVGWLVEQMPIELNEGRSLDVEEVAHDKMRQAREMFPNHRLVVEDRGFMIPALNNFPGPFVKLVLNSIGVKGLLKLLEGEVDRRAIFASVLGYWDGEVETYFKDEEVGFIISREGGTNNRGWGDLLYIYGYPLYANRSLAELNDQEWEAYLEEIEKNDYIKSFIRHIQSSIKR